MVMRCCIPEDFTNTSGLSGREPGQPHCIPQTSKSFTGDALAMLGKIWCQTQGEKSSAYEIHRITALRLCCGGIKFLSMRAIDGEPSA